MRVLVLRSCTKTHLRKALVVVARWPARPQAKRRVRRRVLVLVRRASKNRD
jgi:hypothetical protein